MPDQKEVTISLKRYDDLASLEARVGVFVDLVASGAIISIPRALSIIRTPEAIEALEEMEDKENNSDCKGHEDD